ncbi:MAG: flagellar biosynthetic protein FliQ [Candidatus Wallbacteria bacterium]
MDERVIMEQIAKSLYVTMIVAGPLVMISLVVGLIVSVLQTAFSIQEQTLSFVPKVVIMSLTGIFLGNWMLRFITDYTRDIFINMANYIK